VHLIGVSEDHASNDLIQKSRSIGHRQPLRARAEWTNSARLVGILPPLYRRRRPALTAGPCAELRSGAGEVSRGHGPCQLRPIRLSIAPGPVCAKAGPALTCPVTQDDLARRYGYFIDHLIRNDLFKPDAPPAGQVTPDRIEAFVEELRARVGSVTTAQTIHKLRRAAQLLESEPGLHMARRDRKGLRRDDAPQSKDHRIVDPDRLFEAGLALIDEATANPHLTPLRRARQVRNGVMVALLVLCPIRLKNLLRSNCKRAFDGSGRDGGSCSDRKDTKSIAR